MLQALAPHLARGLFVTTHPGAGSYVVYYAVKQLQIGGQAVALPAPATFRSLSDKPGRDGDSDNGGHWGDKVMAFVGLKSKDGSQARGSSKGGKAPEGGDDDAAATAATATVDGEAAATSALVPASPEHKYKKVLAVELQRKPLFPGIFYPVTVTRNEKLIKEIVEQRRQGGQAYVAAFLRRPDAGLKDSVEDVEVKDAAAHMYEVGTFAQVHAVVTGDNADSAQLLLAGHRRVRRTSTTSSDPLRVAIQHLKDTQYKQDDIFKAKCMEIVNTMRELMTLSPLYGEQFKTMMQLFAVDLNDPSRLTDIGASLSTADEATLQTVLETLSVPERCDKVLLLLKKEVELVKIQADIREQVESKIMKEQRKMLLMEQMRSIKKELGLEKDDKAALIQRFQQRWDPKKDAAPEDVRRVVQDELEKLSGLEPVSPEFNVTRNYLEWLTALPWGVYSKEIFDTAHARQVLDEDHYGLDDVKKRILEFIAVSRLRGSAQGKILCLVGPPGVGKTSVGRSIARTLHRKYYRFSVGGLYDVAEIKGHRRTYVGAMPGKLVQCLKSTQTSNPLVLIDEIDKLGRGHAGDPASALLELLDPEQNSGFLDHYLDVPIDLSKVLFVCTANVLDTIPGPLLDRMEVIRIAGYTEDEKRHIARQYLEKQATKDAGIPQGACSITDDAMRALISDYNREAGVRNLKKNLEQIYRKVALKLVEAGAKGPKDDEEQAAAAATTVTEGDAATPEVVVVSSEDKAQQEQVTASYSGDPVLVDSTALKEYVGPAPFHKDRFYDTTPPGVVMGLAWTAMGGASLYVEASKVYESEAKGSLHTTGQLGDVMKESASIAHTFARSFLATADPHNHFFSTSAIHVHVPAGATPKDGPSAGCTMITALLSLAVNKAVAPDLAMTGEVTLTGRLLPIGGVKEKLLAARRSGIRTVIFPEANRKDYEELSADIREGIATHFVTHYSEIFKLALEYDGPIQQASPVRT